MCQTLIGGDFNVIPEDIDCHKPSSWEHDTLFQPEPRARYRAMLGIGYTDAFRSLHVGEIGHFTFWDYFRQAFLNNRGIRIDHFSLSPTRAYRLESCDLAQNRTTSALTSPTGAQKRRYLRSRAYRKRGKSVRSTSGVGKPELLDLIIR